MVIGPASTSEPMAHTSNARQLPVEGACDPEINWINCSVKSGGRMGYQMWISSEKAANALHSLSSCHGPVQDLALTLNLSAAVGRRSENRPGMPDETCPFFPI
jgi:hypothetical protein